MKIKATITIGLRGAEVEENLFLPVLASSITDIPCSVPDLLAGREGAAEPNRVQLGRVDHLDVSALQHVTPPSARAILAGLPNHVPEQLLHLAHCLQQSRPAWVGMFVACGVCINVQAITGRSRDCANS